MTYSDSKETTIQLFHSACKLLILFIRNFPTVLFFVPRAKARFSSGCESPRQLSFQPVAIGAIVEVTKRLKPPVISHLFAPPNTAFGASAPQCRWLHRTTKAAKTNGGLRECAEVPSRCSLAHTEPAQVKAEVANRSVAVTSGGRC